jgi:hypothetical protein
MHAVNKLEEFSDSVVHEQLMTAQADLSIDLFRRAISCSWKIHGWRKEPSYKSYQSTSPRTEHRLDSTKKTSWIKIKSKTIQEFIKTRQRLQLKLTMLSTILPR